MSNSTVTAKRSRSDFFFRVLLLGSLIALSASILVAGVAYAKTDVYEVPLKQKGLRYQHEFKDGDLHKVRLINEGKPLEVKMFNQSYSLGTNDSVEINPPNVRKFFVHVQPIAKHNTYQPLLHSAHQRSYLVHLPKQKNTDVTH